MSFLFDNKADYDEEIDFVRLQMRKGVGAEKWQLNTSQSNQKVERNLKEMRLYLQQLCGERTAFCQRAAGAGVTSITVRRTY